MLGLLSLFLLGQLAPIPGLTLREQASFGLFDPSVQQAIGMNASEVATFETTVRTYDARRSALPSGASEAQRVALDRRFAAEAMGGLSVRERRVLFLRTVRKRGVAAVADPEVAREIGLREPDLARVQAAVRNMDHRDGDIPEELANAALREREPKTDEERTASAARRVARAKAAEPKLLARAQVRKHEENLLFASLPKAVRAAFVKLVKER